MQNCDILSIIHDALECTKELDNSLAGGKSCISYTQRYNDKLVIGVINKEDIVEEWELKDASLNKLCSDRVKG